MSRDGRSEGTGTGALAASVGAAAGAVAAGALTLPLGLAHVMVLERSGPLADGDVELIALAWMLSGALLGGLWGCYGALRTANERDAARTLTLLALASPLVLAVLVGAGRAVTPSFAVLLLGPALAFALLAGLTRRLDQRWAARS